jgi:stage V sporulation protein K
VNYIHFEDYTPDELTKIFVSFCNENNYSLSGEALEIAKKVIASAYAKKEKSFGNARYCRNLFEQIIRYQAQRIGEEAVVPTVSQLRTIDAQDVSPLLGL